MKIKFLSPELANYTGLYGPIEFKDGVSVNDVPESEARRFGAITQIEVIGNDFSPEKSYDEIKRIAAVSTTLPTMADILARQATAAPVAAPVEVAAPSVIYTKEQLEAVADKDGIAGLRAIGDTLDVRAHSITKLIAAILAAQAKFQPAADFIDEPAEAVSLTVTDPLIAEKAE